MKREEAIEYATAVFQSAIDEGYFSGTAMAEDEAWARSWPYWQAVADTGVSRPQFDEMQRELADKASNDPIWRQAAVITADFIVRRGLAVEPSLGKLFCDEVASPKSSGKGGRPPSELLYLKQLCILEIVECLSSDDYNDRECRVSQSDAFEIVSESLKRLKQTPNTASGVKQAFFREKQMRSEEQQRSENQLGVYSPRHHQD